MTDEPAGERNRRIEDEVDLAADPETVYAAWTDPDELARWFVDRATGTAEPGEEMVWAWDGYDLEQTLNVVEAEAGKRLVLEAAWGDGALTVIEVTLEPLDHGTRLRLVHSGFHDGADWDGEYEGARSGWTNALAHLKHYLESHRGRDKAAVDVFEPTWYDTEEVLALTRTREGLASWFGRADRDLGAVGSRVSMELRDGGTLTGEVLALTDWETVVSWEELSGALTFQAFPGEDDVQGGQRMLGLRLVSWSGDADEIGAPRNLLEAALGRLVTACRSRPGQLVDDQG